MTEVLSSFYYTIFPINFKPEPVKFQATFIRRQCLQRYPFGPATLAERNALRIT